MSECSRCPGDDPKKSVTGIYKAKSTLPISKDFAISKKIKNRIDGALTKKIQTCNICTSPTSRTDLHEKNVFKRYEFQFLNLIIKDVMENHGGADIMMNKTNISDSKQYDTLITKGYKEDIKDRIKIALNIEVDESDHYTVQSYFTRDRAKEENFFNVREQKGGKAYIIRVRVGEKFNTSCVKKEGKGKEGECSVTDTTKFNKNMALVQKYVDDALNGKKMDKHVYINFADNNGIIKYPYTDFAAAQASALKSTKSLPNLPTKPVKDILNDLTTAMSNVKIAESSRKRVECSRKNCKEKTTSVVGKCKKHR